MKTALAIPTNRAIKKLGHDIQRARLRRRISTKIMAERAGISRTTLYKIEQGNAGVSLGHYASVIFILGMIDDLAHLIDGSKDRLGQDLDDDNLPKRIRVKEQE